MLSAALKHFAEEPDVKTSCIRLKYISTGYHVDFAIFSRFKENQDDNEYAYEHAGATWSRRHLKTLEDWFNNEMKIKGILCVKLFGYQRCFVNQAINGKICQVD